MQTDVYICGNNRHDVLFFCRPIRHRLLLWHVISRCLCLFVCYSVKCSSIVVNDINKCYIYVSRPFVFVLKMNVVFCLPDWPRTTGWKPLKNHWKTVEKAFSNALWVVFFELYWDIWWWWCAENRPFGIIVLHAAQWRGLWGYSAGGDPFEP